MASGKTQKCGYAIYNKWLNPVLMTPKLLLGPQTPACPDLDMSQAHYHTGDILDGPGEILHGPGEILDGPGEILHRPGMILDGPGEI